ncbi:MAG TPA: 2-keto-4-pentenoate hydratase [Acidobacteriaceae bacterium]|nr:2-keto-4-pentenoate hydratase [Acidobacteriaceae bacterium]
MTGPDELRIIDATDALLNARRTGHLLADLPANLQPQSLDEAYAIHDRIAPAFGEIGGWKIGAGTPEATPMYAPMPLAWIAASGSTLAGERWRYRGLEAEIAFLVGRDLPPRAHPYTREETLAAMASCHPAIEILEPAFEDPTKAARLAVIADLQMHGGFVYGPAVSNWQSIDFTKEHVMLAVDGIVRVERTGSNTAGDLLRLLPWLANEGAARTGGLRKGQWITTGSWTGNTLASAGSAVEVVFSTAGRVDLRFA